MKYRIVKRINPLNKTEEKYYAAPQYMEELTVLDLAKDISDACTLNVTDVEAVLTSLVRKLPLYLKKRIQNPAWKLWPGKTFLLFKGIRKP